MATKKDLIDAQSYSRRRLLAAFTAGAPGGKEVEPKSPLKAVIGGVVLAAMVLLGGVFYGFANPGLPLGWESNRLVMVKDTGSRYLSVEGTLYPVLNTTSARLLVEANEFQVISTDSGSIADIPVGPVIGIVGAPDDVPAASALAGSGWTACAAPAGTAVSVPGDPDAEETGAGVVVVSEGKTYVVAGGYRYAVSAQNADAVLRSAGLAEATEVQVDSRWLNLFDEGAPLEALNIERAGEPLGDGSLVIGAVVYPESSTNRFLVTEDGELAAISPLAYQMYLLGTGSYLGGEREVAPSAIATLPTASAGAGAANWPTDPLEPFARESAPCGLLQHSSSGIASTTLAQAPIPEAGGVQVASRAGALVASGGRGDQSTLELVLVDESGTAFPLPAADAAVLSRLGYDGDTDVVNIPQVWMQYFTSGPALTVEAAGATPSGRVIGTEPGSDTPDSDQSLVADATITECRPGNVQFTEETPPAFRLIQTEAAWERATGAGVVVAVVDSGIDVNNAHLRDVVIGGIDLVGDGEGKGGTADFDGHGTAIAGIIAAQEVDGSGVVGLAPDARLLSVRVFQSRSQQAAEAGYGPSSVRLAQGIEWAADNGADIINVSLSDHQDHPDVRAAVAKAHRAGALVVASAGNRETATSLEDGPRYPGAHDGALAVAALDRTGLVTEHSIHGPHVDLAAPGQDVLTAATGGGDCWFNQDVPSTSYATAYASASAALVLDSHPHDSPDELSYRLLASAARGNADSRDDKNGWGAVQPYDAITLIPGSDQRGPANPFTGMEAPTQAPSAVHLVPVASERPHASTQTFTIAAGAAGLLALAGLGAGIALRRRESAPEPAEQTREGLLDSTRSASIQILP